MANLADRFSPFDVQEIKAEGSVEEELCGASVVSVDVGRSRFTSMSSDGTMDQLSVLAEDLNVSCSDTSSPLPDCFAHVSFVLFAGRFHWSF